METIKLNDIPREAKGAVVNLLQGFTPDGVYISSYNQLDIAFNQVATLLDKYCPQIDHIIIDSMLLPAAKSIMQRLEVEA